MIFRISLIIICLLLHLLTPSWFKSDIVEILDWVMITTSFISALLYYFFNNIKSIKNISLWISLNAIVYYLVSMHGCTFEVLESDCSASRLTAIFDISISLNTEIVELIEWINIIQVIINLILILILGFFAISKKKNKAV